jgi:hypothetical protein
MPIAFQIAGAVLILVGFAAAQFGMLTTSSLSYLVVNFVGSAILGVDALASHSWGFVLLEGVWAIVSAIGLVGALRPGTREAR